eukprot:gene29475-33285_t
MKTPPTPLEVIPCTLSLYDFLILWYERSFSPGDHGTRWSTKIKQDKTRIGQVLTEVTKIAKAESTEAALQAHNYDKLSCACRAIVDIVHRKYTAEGTDFNKPPTISAIA